MRKEFHLIGCCGLDCSECEIYAATDNLSLAEQLANWMQKVSNLYVDPRDVHCRGCRGDRDCHWQPNCPILICCVDERKLDFCNECPDFPCEKLTEWSKKDKRNMEALEWLKKTKKHKPKKISEPKFL
uniref:DUF3795 domain-containing protein n=1 Tax=candidate division WOR-3 bacterium TaxID=2052148 RepID=A0A7C6E9T9_UNCW3